MSARNGVAIGALTSGDVGWLSRAALTFVGLFCTCCAANPELRRASDLGAQRLQCAAGTAEAKLEQDHGTWRAYVIECDLTVVRVACFDDRPCELETAVPPRPPLREQML